MHHGQREGRGHGRRVVGCEGCVARAHCLVHGGERLRHRLRQLQEPQGVQRTIQQGLRMGLEALIGGKILAHWLTTGLPVVLLAPLLGIDDPRTSKRVDFVGGIRGTGELVQRVNADAGVAFSLYPVSIGQLMDIADAGQIMPPKSTWFEPKLRSGLLVHTLE